MPFLRGAIHREGSTNARDRHHGLLEIDGQIVCGFALCINIVCIGCFSSLKTDEIPVQTKPTQAKEPSPSQVVDSKGPSSKNGIVANGRDSLHVEIEPVSAYLCKGECISIVVKATGGVAPYSFSWDPNLPSTIGPHRVCPEKTTNYTVIVRDTGLDTEEFSRPSEVSSTSTTITVRDDCATPNPVDSGIDSSSEASTDDAGDALADQAQDAESTESLGDGCPFPPRKGVVNSWDETDLLDFDTLLGVTGTDLVASWSCGSSSTEWGPFTGYLYAYGDTDEIAGVLDKPIDEISDISSLVFDAWVTPVMKRGGIGVLRSRITGCTAALRFDDFAYGFYPDTHEPNSYLATVSWFFAGASADFSSFR